MNCDDFQKLIDSHLDGELAGTLRLEFDAHRVHCDHCEHTVAVLESVTNVISAPKVAPLMSDNFADDVLSKIAIGQKQTREIKYRGLRNVIVFGAVVQAAAVLMFALWPRTPEPIPVTTPPEQIQLASVTPETLTKYIYDLTTEKMKLAGGFEDELLQIKNSLLALNVQQDIAYDPVRLLSAWLPAPEPELDSDTGDQFAF